jgi:hypothetical protein
MLKCPPTATKKTIHNTEGWNAVSIWRCYSGRTVFSFIPKKIDAFVFKSKKS